MPSALASQVRPIAVAKRFHAGPCRFVPPVVFLPFLFVRSVARRLELWLRFLHQPFGGLIPYTVVRVCFFSVQWPWAIVLYTPRFYLPETYLFHQISFAPPRWQNFVAGQLARFFLVGPAPPWGLIPFITLFGRRNRTVFLCFWSLVWPSADAP